MTAKRETDAMREALEKELADLEAANEAATSWGAAVGARHERIKGIRSQLATLSPEVASDGEELVKLAKRAIENAETAAQLEIKDAELRDSLVRNIVATFSRTAAAQSVPGEAVRYPIRDGMGFELVVKDVALAREHVGSVGGEITPLYAHPPSPAGAVPGREDELASMREEMRAGLKSLRSYLRGGNATNDTAQLLTFIADRLVNVHGENPNTDYIRALRERAEIITAGIKRIDAKLLENAK